MKHRVTCINIHDPMKDATMTGVDSIKDGLKLLEQLHALGLCGSHQFVLPGNPVYAALEFLDTDGEWTSYLEKE